MKRKPRAAAGRPARREAAREQEKLASARARLFALEAGGRPERPIDVVSAALVDAKALSFPCPRCDGAHELLEHAARVIDGARLREALLRCRQCGTKRSLWFRLIGSTQN